MCGLSSNKKGIYRIVLIQFMAVLIASLIMPCVAEAKEFSLHEDSITINLSSKDWYVVTADYADIDKIEKLGYDTELEEDDVDLIGYSTDGNTIMALTIKEDAGANILSDYEDEYILDQTDDFINIPEENIKSTDVVKINENKYLRVQYNIEKQNSIVPCAGYITVFDHTVYMFEILSVSDSQDVINNKLHNIIRNNVTYDYQGNYFPLLIIMLNLAITMVAYILPVVIFSEIMGKKKKRNDQEYKKYAIIITILVCSIFVCIKSYMFERPVTSGAALLWGPIAYKISLSRARKRDEVQSNLENAVSIDNDLVVEDEEDKNFKEEIITIKEGKIEIIDSEAECEKTGMNGLPIDNLRKLKALHDEGILTDKEFSEKKKQLLNI